MGIMTVERLSISTSVPDQAFQADVPMVAAIRSGRVETLHRGTLAICNHQGRVLVAAGNPRQRTYLRSSAKPFQAMALVTTGAADVLSLSPADIAIACSSHSGEPEHVAAVRALLDKAGLTPDLLRCGIHRPLGGEADNNSRVRSAAVTVLHNNCSGKHAAMLATCKVMGWPLDSYLASDHPLQRLNLETLSAFSGIEGQAIEMGIDGCGVPAFYLTIAGIATAFARLSTGEGVSAELREAARRVRDAMTEHPFLIGGTRRLDTDVMAAAAGLVICKGGAQGCEGIGLPGRGIGIGLKITDGASQPIGVVAYQALRATGSLDEEALSRLASYGTATLRNHAGTVVGSLEATFAIEPS